MQAKNFGIHFDAMQEIGVYLVENSPLLTKENVFDNLFRFCKSLCDLNALFEAQLPNVEPHWNFAQFEVGQAIIALSSLIRDKQWTEHNTWTGIAKGFILFAKAFACDYRRTSEEAQPNYQHSDDTYLTYFKMLDDLEQTTSEVDNLEMLLKYLQSIADSISERLRICQMWPVDVSSLTLKEEQMAFADQFKAKLHYAKTVFLVWQNFYRADQKKEQESVLTDVSSSSEYVVVVNEQIPVSRAEDVLKKRVQNPNEEIVWNAPEEEKDDPLPDPPPIYEHCGQLDRRWVEYCYEGCMNSEGSNIHYSMTEGVCSADRRDCFAYVTPPVSYPKEGIPLLEKLLVGYMEGVTKKDCQQKFYYIDLFANVNTPDNKPEYAMCEINPRFTNNFQFGYLFAYDVNTYRDSCDLADGDIVPSRIPWNLWKSGLNKYCTQIILAGKQESKVCDIIDYEFIDGLDADETVKQVRHMKDREYVLTANDAASVDECILLYIWILTDTAEDAARQEMYIRKNAYKEDVEWQYPKLWTDLARKS